MLLKPFPVPHLPAIKIANLLTVLVPPTEPDLWAEVPASHAEVESELSPPNSLDLPPKSALKTSLCQTRRPWPIKPRFQRPAPRPRSKTKAALSPRDPLWSTVESKSLKRVRTPAREPPLPSNAARKLLNLSNLSPSRATPALQLLFQALRVMSTMTNPNAMATPTEMAAATE